MKKRTPPRRPAITAPQTERNADRRAKQKRAYTMSDAALEQRRAAQPAAVAAGTLAGKSTGPVTEAGKAAASRNGWVHGRYSAINRAQFGLGAASVSKLFGKPCVTTCPFHPDNPERREAPCSLVLDGMTHAGGSCLDKTVYVHALQGLMDAMRDGEMDGVHGLLATEMASTLQLLQKMRESIAEVGVVVEIPVVTKDGHIPINPLTDRAYIAEIKANPILSHLIMLMDRLGINFGELMATPKAREKLKDEADGVGALQNLLGGIFSRAAKQLPARGRTLDHDE